MIRAPQPPPEPVFGVPGPTFLACDRHVWRRGMGFWTTVDGVTAPKLLAGFRADATDTTDWFHARAAELADELETAIRNARNLAQMEKAA